MPRRVARAAAVVQGVLGAALLAAGAAPLAAQEGPSETVSGFNGLAWGASRAEVEAALGPALQEETLDEGITVLAYRDSVGSESSVTLYALLGDRGMVKGQHTLAVDRDDCETQYRRLRDEVKLRYPLITPVERTQNPSLKGFCEAVRDGIASWATQWTDPENGAVVTVILEPGSDNVQIIYESAAFIEWVNRRP